MVSHHLCLAWLPQAFRKWIYKVFNLSRDLLRSRDQRVMQLYGWEFLIVCHKFGN